MSGEVAHALQSRHAKPHKCSQAICHLVQPWVQRPKGPATKHHISCLRRLRDRRDYKTTTLSSSGSGPGESENQTPPSPLLASLARHAPFMALQAASSVPRAAGLARQPRQLRAWRRREIGARWPASPRDSRSSTSAPTPSRWPLTTAGASGANVESKATAGERRAAEVVVRNGELEGNYSSSNSAARHRSALPCIHADKNYASFPATHPTQVLLLYGRFRPHVAIDPRACDLKLVGAVHLRRAGSPRPSNSPLDPRSAIDFALLFVCVLCSHVARRRPAREHRRPRARSRRVGGAHDVQLDGAAASRHAEPSSRSPVPVPAAHGALGMCLDDTPPTLVPRPHRG